MADGIDDNCGGNNICFADVYAVMMRGRCYAAYALHESVFVAAAVAGLLNIIV